MTIPTIKARIRTGQGSALCASELSEFIGAIGPLLGSVTLLCMYTILGCGYRCPAVSHLEKDSAKSGQIHRFRPRSNRWAYNHHAVAGGEKCRLKSTEQVVDRGPRMEEGHDGITSEPDKNKRQCESSRTASSAAKPREISASCSTASDLSREPRCPSHRWCSQSRDPTWRGAS